MASQRIVTTVARTRPACSYMLVALVGLLSLVVSGCRFAELNLGRGRTGPGEAGDGSGEQESTGATPEAGGETQGASTTGPGGDTGTTSDSSAGESPSGTEPGTQGDATDEGDTRGDGHDDGGECKGRWKRCRGEWVCLTDTAAHCGDCDIECRDGEQCKHGLCGAECGDDQDKCKGPLAHCASQGGYCKCRPGAQACGTHCANLDADPNNCGVCNHVCDKGNICRDGECVPKGDGCAEGEEVCMAGCRDLQTDIQHCGRCEHSCPPPNRFCRNGECGRDL